MTVPAAGRPTDVATRVAAVALAVSVVGSVLLAVVYWRGGNVQLEGLGLFLALTGMGVALIVWGRHLLDDGTAVEPREQLATSASDREAFERSIERDDRPDRRTLLRRMLMGSVGALGLALVFPLRSLGPQPTEEALETSPWRDGLRLVDQDGGAIVVDQLPVGGLVTAFPEGSPGSADGQLALLRLQPGLVEPRPGREDWSPEGLVAYSRVCTHAGCPVGLYLADTHELLCPCHQSAFDALRGAAPTRGPAARPLPQLPLRLDTQGVVIAAGDLSAPVGPAWWSRP